MDIYTIIFLIAYFCDLESVSAAPSRANTRAKRDRAIAHNHRVYHNVLGDGIWFEMVDENGTYSRYTGGNKHNNKQRGRWATVRLSGHRRFAKWERDYYPSGADYMGKLRWEEELKEYLNS